MKIQKTFLLIFVITIYFPVLSQDNKPEIPTKTDCFYIAPMAGRLVNGSDNAGTDGREPQFAIGLKIGIAKKGFGRIGPQVFVSLPDANILAFSIVDYDYPFRIADMLYIDPNIGFGYTYYTKSYYVTKGSFGVNAGLSIEARLQPKFGVRIGMSSMFGFEDITTYSLFGGLVFLL